MGVHVRGVDEVAAGLDVRIQHRERGLLVGGPAEGVAAQAQGRHIEITDSASHGSEGTGT
jgi:hypothetical protein